MATDDAKQALTQAASRARGTLEKFGPKAIGQPTQYIAGLTTGSTAFTLTLLAFGSVAAFPLAIATAAASAGGFGGILLARLFQRKPRHYRELVESVDEQMILIEKLRAMGAGAKQVAALANKCADEAGRKMFEAPNEQKQLAAGTPEAVSRGGDEKAA